VDRQSPKNNRVVHLKLGLFQSGNYQIERCVDAPLAISISIRRYATRSLGRTGGARRGCRINRQSDVFAECGLQTLDGAILIPAACSAADADGADHLSVDNDRNA